MGVEVLRRANNRVFSSLTGSNEMQRDCLFVSLACARERVLTPCLESLNTKNTKKSDRSTGDCQKKFINRKRTNTSFPSYFQELLCLLGWFAPGLAIFAEMSCDLCVNVAKKVRSQFHDVHLNVMFYSVFFVV